MDVGANCHAFWDQHAFFALFQHQTSVQVAGGSKFQAHGVGLVPIVFPGSTKICSLAPAHWEPSDSANTSLLGALKTHSGFTQASHEEHVSYTFTDSEGHQFTV